MAHLGEGLASSGLYEALVEQQAVVCGFDLRGVSRLLQFVEEGSVRRVDLYDQGRTALALVRVAEREQQLACDLPGATTGLLEKLQTKGVVIEVRAL